MRLQVFRNNPTEIENTVFNVRVLRMNFVLRFHLLLLAIFRELRGFTVGYVFENTLCGTEGQYHKCFKVLILDCKYRYFRWKSYG